MFPVRFRDSALVRYFGGGADHRPEEFPIGGEVTRSGTGQFPAFLLLIGETPTGVSPDSPLAAVVRDNSPPMASIQSELGLMVLYRLKSAEAQPSGLLQ